MKNWFVIYVSCCEMKSQSLVFSLPIKYGKIRSFRGHLSVMRNCPNRVDSFPFYSMFCWHTKRKRKRKHDAPYSICKKEKKESKKQADGKRKEGEMAAINLLCDDSRSSETSNQAHLLSECGRKRPLYWNGLAALQPALWKQQKCHLVSFTQKVWGNSADISNLAIGVFMLLPLLVSHPRGDGWEQMCYTCQMLERFNKIFFSGQEVWTDMYKPRHIPSRAEDCAIWRLLLQLWALWRLIKHSNEKKMWPEREERDKIIF